MMNFINLPRAAGGFMLAGLLWWVVMLFILSGVLMWLWNITITRIFSVRELTYWEAFRLFIICSILFGNSGFNFNLGR